MRKVVPFVIVSLLALVALPAAPATAAPSVEEIRLLERAAPLTGANGIVFDENDRLYVGSVGGREIVKMDANSGRILARFGPDQGFEGADDVALGPDGAIYYTALFTGEIGKIGPDGSHSTVANLPLGVNPITFSDDGRLFVGLAFLGDALYEVDLTGGPPRLISEGLGLNGFDWWDGYLYAPRMYAGTAVRIDVETGDYDLVADGFVFPTAVDFDPAGRMYVLDSGGGEVVRVDPDTGHQTVVAMLDGDPDNMAFDARGRLFVSDNSAGSIVQVLRNGSIRPVSPGGIAGPSGLAVLSAGRTETVYAADIFRLFGIDGRTGRTSLEVEASITGGGALAAPMTAGAYDSDLVLSSWFGSAVQVFDPQTRQVEATCLDTDVPLNAMGFDGDILVSELMTNRVAVLDESNCTRTTLVNLAVPTGLATDGEDLWVADWYLGMVFQIADDGAFIPPTPVAFGLAGPEGLAVSPDGGLLVVESFLHRVSHIDLGTGALTPLVEGLALGAEGPPTMPPTWLFDGIAVGPSGAVYVSAHGLYRIDLVR